MQVINFPAKNTWKELLRRPAFDLKDLEATVGNIIQEVRANGDEAVKQFSLMFDKVALTDLAVPGDELEKAGKQLDDELKNAILQAKRNIEIFHNRQLQKVEVIETMPGISCWRKPVAIEKVGLYIPGGTAPLFSTLLMLAIPAKIAGCKEMILCSPPDTKGNLHPALLYTAQLTGINKIFRVGGVQAIAAMAHGTQTIPSVYKIFGPGNQYVTCAKRLVQKDGVAIDMPAGPSELAVYADDVANPAFVAADLLSQAEHGVDSQVILVTCSPGLPVRVLEEMQKQIDLLPRKAIAKRALENSKAILLRNEVEAMELLNEYAAEHLMLACANADSLAEKVINAGSVFLGHFSPESAGDYASGTNHTLPTNGNARAYGGISVDSFVKKISFQRLTEQGLHGIGKTIGVMAEAEGLHAHANAVRIRLDRDDKF